MTYADRFWSKVRKTETCWFWDAYRNHEGYGSYHGPDGVRTTAHRIAWVLTGRTIPDGYHLDHLCRVRECVNPAHLDPVTPRENALRGNTLQAANAAKTHCPVGHPLDGERGDGSRYCRACNRARNNAYRAEHLEASRARDRVKARVYYAAHRDEVRERQRARAAALGDDDD